MWRQAGNTGAVGIEVVLALAIGYLGGHFLDRKLHTTPYLTWFLSICGVGAAIKALVRVARQYKAIAAEPSLPTPADDPPEDDDEEKAKRNRDALL